MNRTTGLLFVLLIPCTLLAQDGPTAMQRYAEEMDGKIPELMADFSIPGAAIAIIENGEIILKKCYGFSDLKNGTRITPDTGFNIGSISKVLTGWGVMKLVEDEKLDLDAPVENYLSRWHLPESEFDKGGVTLRRLLSHTAGINLGSVSREISFDDLPTLVEWLNGDNDGLGPVKITSEPGAEWHYSGGGFGIAQLIIEEVSGQPFEDFMQAEVLDPLGMTSSSFRITEKIRNGSATPYDNFGEEIEFGLYTVQSAAGFHTTLNDFIRFMIASLPDHPNHGKVNAVLPPETVLRMHEPAPNTKIGGWKYGLGYQSVHFDDGRIFIGHGGSNSGWQANFRIESETMNGFIAFTNGSYGDRITSPMFCKLTSWTSEDMGKDECWWKRSIAQRIGEEMEENGTENIAAIYEDLKEEHADEYDFSEGQLNNLGYHYLEKKEMDKAIAAFELNIAAYPYASNPYDSYGEALLAKGDTSLAIENYRHSILLNPQNNIGISVLKGLGESVDDIQVMVLQEHLQLLAGEYYADELDKTILYQVRENGLLRTYKDRDFTMKLIPIGNDEFVYLDRNIHVRFDTSNPKEPLLHVTGEGTFKKVD